MPVDDSRIDRQFPCRPSITLLLTDNDRAERHPRVDGFRVDQRLAYLLTIPLSSEDTRVGR